MTGVQTCALPIFGQEPQTQARVYTFTGTSFTANILGVGSVRQQQPAASEEDTGAPKCCEETPARVNQQMTWVLSLGFGILALGGMLLFRRGQA